jgi:hypothetical protein
MGSAKFTFPEHPIIPNIHRTGDGFHGLQVHRAKGFFFISLPFSMTEAIDTSFQTYSITETSIKNAKEKTAETFNILRSLVLERRR